MGALMEYSVTLELHISQMSKVNARTNLRITDNLRQIILQITSQ